MANYSYLQVSSPLLQSMNQNISPNPMGYSMGLNDVRSSKDNMFSSNMLPAPPKFMFQDRQGKVNWR